MSNKSGSFNYSSMMDVIRQTVQDDNGLRIPGELMPSGKPVTAAGATLDLLMSNRDIAEKWFESVKGQYEREKDEANQPRSQPPADVDASQGSAPTARIGNGVPNTEEGGQASLKETLQARSAYIRLRSSELHALLADAEAEYRTLRDEQHAIDAALGLLSGDPSEDMGPAVSPVPQDLEGEGGTEGEGVVGNDVHDGAAEEGVYDRTDKEDE